MEIYPQNLGPEGEPILQARAQYLAPRREAAWPVWVRIGGIYGGIGAAFSLLAEIASEKPSVGWLCFLASSLFAVFMGMLRQNRSGGPAWEIEPLTVYEVRDLQYG